MHQDRDEMLQWLNKHCLLKIEWDFWHQLYDDLDDCFDDLEPWRMAKMMGWEWHSWDKKFTSKMIEPDDETRNEREGYCDL